MQDFSLVQETKLETIPAMMGSWLMLKFATAPVAVGIAVNIIGSQKKGILVS